MQVYMKEIYVNKIINCLFFVTFVFVLNIITCRAARVHRATPFMPKIR